MSERDADRRLPTAWRFLPVVVALLAASFELFWLGGLFFPDSAAFLTHTWHAHFNLRFATFNPAYPLLLDALCFAVPSGARMATLVVLQQLAVASIPWLVLRCGEQLERPRIGFVAAMLTALHAPLSLFAQSAQSDSLFAFLIALTSYWVVRAMTTRRPGAAWLAGALAIGAVAQRSSGVALIAAIGVAVLLTHPRRDAPLLGRFLCGAALMLGLVLTRNRLDFGSFALVKGSGIHLFCRVAGLERELPDTLEARQLEALGRASGMPSLFVGQAGWRLHQLLLEHEQLTPEQADQRLGVVAMQALAADPWRSARLTVDSMITSVGRCDPAQYTIGATWTLDAFARFEAKSASTWSASPERFAKALELLPPYAPRSIDEGRSVRLLRAWSRLSRAWCGGWILIALFASGLIGLVRRDRALLFCAGLPFAQLAASAIGDIPFPGHFDPVVPITWLALLLAATGGSSRTG